MLEDGTTMSQRGALGPKEVPMLGSVPKECPYELVPFCSCWPPLLHYHSSAPVCGNMLISVCISMLSALSDSILHNFVSEFAVRYRPIVRPVFQRWQNNPGGITWCKI